MRTDGVLSTLVTIWALQEGHTVSAGLEPTYGDWLTIIVAITGAVVTTVA